MSLFKDILLEMRLLKEEASVTDINDAIDNLLTATIEYNDGDGSQGKRVICPVAYGMSTKGNPVVRAFQVSGPSKSGHKPNWRLFKVDNIESWDNLPSQKYNPKKLVGLNTEDDAQMSTIYAIAKIGSAKNIEKIINKGTGEKLKSTPIKKKDVTGHTETEREEVVDNENYTADNAINDILRSSGNADLIGKQVDNTQKSDYISKNKLDAPETTPVLRSDIIGGEEPVSDNQENKTPEVPTTSEPVKKKDLETVKDISDNFKSMMDRMDKAENNEED